jgi:hypothetical protein
MLPLFKKTIQKHIANALLHCRKEADRLAYQIGLPIKALGKVESTPQ